MMNFFFSSAISLAEADPEALVQYANDLWADREFWIIKFNELVARFLPRLLGGLLLLVVGWFAISWLGRMLHKVFAMRSFDVSVENFLVRLITITLRILLVVAAAGVLGFQTSGLVAMLGAGTLAIGMALSGALQNFAGGVMVLVQRPFRLGNVIEIDGKIGKVVEIGIFRTELQTLDTKKVMVPNSHVISSTLINFSAYEFRQLDLVFGVSYDDNIDMVRDAIKRVVDAEERIIQDEEQHPLPDIFVKALGDSSVDFALRAWCKAEDYWPVTWSLHEQIKKEFDRSGIEIPFPHQVHVNKNS